MTAVSQAVDNVGSLARYTNMNIASTMYMNHQRFYGDPLRLGYI